MDLLYRSKVFTPPGGFTSGIEGPACDWEGNLFAVNFGEQHTVGIVTPSGKCSVFLRLASGSIGNGIRFTSGGDMLIADYVNHNILRYSFRTDAISVFAHESGMNQPNDIAITADDWIFASDPNWKTLSGNIWRIDPKGEVVLLESEMGTTNGIEVSPDEDLLYVNESRQRCIWVYNISPSKAIYNKRLFHQFEDFSMDGMRCDTEGNLYVTCYDKGTILIFAPDGRPLTEVHLSGKKCSNLAFGGVDGRTCYVTLADTGNIEMFRTQIPGRAYMLHQRFASLRNDIGRARE